MWTVAPHRTWTGALTYITVRALGSAATDLDAYTELWTFSSKQRIEDLSECVHSTGFFSIFSKHSLISFLH